MSIIYRFKRLIDKYSVPFSIEIVGASYYNDIGEKVTAENAWEGHRGALVPLGDQQIAQSGGTLTEADRMLYFTGPKLANGTRIKHEDKIYHVLRINPHETYGDFNSYTVKYVSSFDRVVE